VLTGDTRITVGSRPGRQASSVGYALAGMLRPATGFDIPVVRGTAVRSTSSWVVQQSSVTRATS
jgi:hypothetical protein